MGERSGKIAVITSGGRGFGKAFGVVQRALTVGLELTGTE